MKGWSPTTVTLTVIAYVATTFAVQGLSHFVVNAEHYAAIPIMRDEPVIAMGITAMVVQGLIFAALFPVFHRGDSPVRSGIVLAWMIGGFLTSYIALGEAGKYAVPFIPAWMAVELSTSLVQFTVFGALLGLVHRKRAEGLHYGA